jgi:enoyl-CoA hydratase
VAILTETRDTTGIITINRPNARNAVNREVAEGIEAALDAFDGDDAVSAVVITGAGDMFCAGADLKAAMSDPLGLQTERGGFGGFVKRAFRKPVVAAVNGRALGGGFEIALACHLVVAADDAELGIPEVKRGLIAAGGGLFRLAQRLPRAVALELAMTGDPITAQRAFELGLVNRIVPRESVVDAAVVLAEGIGRNGPVAVGLSRRVVESAANMSDDEGFQLNDEAAEEILQSEDFLEGIQAFVEKREPRWTGR